MKRKHIITMSYKINFINGKLLSRRMDKDNVQHFQKVINGPFQYKGDFFKIITADVQYGELFFGYFTTDPSTFFYGATGRWGKDTVNITKFNEWTAMLITAFRMTKRFRDRTYKEIVSYVNEAIGNICMSHI